MQDKILIIPPDVSLAELGDYAMKGGPVPSRAYEEDFEEWTARGRVPDCDCGLLQCACEAIRPHQKSCAFRLSITSPVDFGPMECDCR